MVLAAFQVASATRKKRKKDDAEYGVHSDRLAPLTEGCCSLGSTIMVHGSDAGPSQELQISNTAWPQALETDGLCPLG